MSQELDKITIDEIRKLLSRGKPVHHKRISEPLQFLANDFSKPFVFRHCVFERHVDLSDSRFASLLSLEYCSFEDGLTLRGIFVGGQVNLSGAKILLSPEAKNKQRFPLTSEVVYEAPRGPRAVRWNSMTVEGEFYAPSLTVEGSLDMGDIKIHKSLILRGCLIGEENFKGRLYLRQSRIHGDLELQCHVDPLDNSEEKVKRSRIHGSLSIGSSELHGRCNLRGIQIGGCLHAIMVRITGRVLADCWTHPNPNVSPIQTYRTTVGLLSPGAEDEDFEARKRISIYLDDARIESAVWMNGIMTEGGVHLENARIGGSLNLDAWQKKPKSSDRNDYSEIGADGSPPRLQEVSEDWLGACLQQLARNLENPNIIKSYGTSRIHFDEEKWLPNSLEALRAAAAAAAGESEAYAAPVMEIQWNLRRAIFGADFKDQSISLRNAQIQGNLEMRGLLTIGRIVGHNLTVRGSIMIQPFQLESEVVSDGIVHYVRPYIGFNPEYKSLSLYGASVGLNIDISGAKLLGAFRMRYAKLRGLLTAKPWEPITRGVQKKSMKIVPKQK